MDAKSADGKLFGVVRGGDAMKPYPFQQEAIDKLTQPKITSRLLGDEMGLLAR